MSRIDIKQLNCPVTMVCNRVGDHSHLRCDECGADDFTGNCLTCVTMRGVTFAGMARAYETPDPED